MAPFDVPKVVLTGFKERPESLLVQGNRLYIGTATGNIHIYELNEGKDTTEGTNPTAILVETKTGISRKAIDQLGYIKDINSLVVLSETIPTVYPIPSFSPPTKLIQAKSALSFAIFSSVYNGPGVHRPDSPASHPSGGFSSEVETGPIPIPIMMTTLVVGCRRKVVVYTWKNGEAQGVKETPLPHSPRAVTFLDSSHTCFAYSPTEYAIFSLENSITVDVTLPTPVPTAPSSSSLGMGTLSGLSSYMSLGLGSKTAKPGLVRVGEREVLVVKENQGFVIDVDAKTRGNSINWPSQPEEIAFVDPYIFSVLPAGTVPVTTESSTNLSNTLLPASFSSSPQAAAQSHAQSSFIQASVIQVISSINMLPVQTIAYPFLQVAASLNSANLPVPNIANSSLRLLATNATSIHSGATSLKTPSHLFLVSTPLDRTLATSEGTMIWRFVMHDWDTQIEELVLRASYTEALALQDRVYGSSPSPKRTLILALNAVSQFRSGRYDDAINTFLDLDINPAKVVALYPDKIAGRLAVKREEWIALFGGPVVQAKEQSGGDNGAEDAMSTKSSEEGNKDGAAASKDKLPLPISRSPSPAGSLRARTKTSFGALLPATVSKEDVVASPSGKKKGMVVDDATRSLETLWRYLTSLRPKLAGALASHHITPSQSHLFPTLSSTSPASLYSLPSGVALSDLTEDELVKRAQIVDTALFKSYLVGRPSMLGPLCRLPNWCEVEEVEEELRAREKHAELIFLYNGRKMHAKALKSLQQLSEREDDMRDKLGPSISYLQKLGPEYLDQIFESARWMFEQDEDMAFEIFTSDDVELPRDAVTDYLEKLDPHTAARYLEYLIDEKEEQSALFHDRLAELYLGITMTPKKKGEEDKHAEVYAKLLRFIDTTEHYRPDRLYGLLPEDLYEARAILLGRMGRHEHALELYVYKLGDFVKAEEHCKRISSSASTPSLIFLTLLKLYLRPTIPNPPNLLSPALSLIARHSSRLDPVETLQLLPPLVNAHDVQSFLIQSLRAPLFDSCVIREVSLARKEDAERQLMKLESRRVKVTDSRICPQCHKRLGNSVIAVHTPRGEVTHYQCREAFSRKLNAARQG